MLAFCPLCYFLKIRAYSHSMEMRSFQSFRSMVFSFQEQRVIFLLTIVQKNESIKRISGSEQNNFLYLEGNDHGTN